MRTECYFKNEILHIFDYYTVCDGEQIAIKGEIEKLRKYGHDNELECLCGCGGKLILVSGKKMLRAPHFRLKSEQHTSCKALEESTETIAAKYILKCWLDDCLRLQANEVLHNVPIREIGNESYRYEYTHYVPSRKLGICYERNESNLYDEKIETLFQNKENSNLYILDSYNAICFGQYPEFGIKVQKAQGFCAFISTNGTAKYDESKLRISIYEKKHIGIWKIIDVCEDKLLKYSFNSSNHLCLNEIEVYKLVEEKRNEFIKQEEEYVKQLEAEREKREEERIQREQEEARRAEEERKRKEKEREVAEQEAERRVTETEYKGTIKEENKTIENIQKVEVSSVELQEQKEIEALEKNPKIKTLKDFIISLDSLEADFTHTSKKDGSSTIIHEKIGIESVKYNNDRTSIEINSEDQQRYFIYLQTDSKQHPYVRFTPGSYLVFKVFDVDENAIIQKFQKTFVCNGKEYKGTYLCTLDFSCDYKDEQTGKCNDTDQDNKCSYRMKKE